MFSRSLSTTTRKCVSKFIQRSSTTRHFSAASSTTDVRERFEQLVPEFRAELIDVKNKYGDAKLGETTVSQVIGGMRGITGILSETSLLDAEEGIRFRGGYSIPELQEKLPKADKEPLPEGLLWLLLTGEVPTSEQVASLSKDLQSRSEIPEHVVKMINAYPKNMHPMTQLCSAVLALQPDSLFAAAYQNEKINKMNAWETTLEDSLNLIAKLPQIAAMIYRNTFHNGDQIEPNRSLDWGGNMAQMLGWKDHSEFADLMRLYLTIHSDHEGGNVSAHATHLVGSALSDPYLSYTAGMTGLAGPLHGLANQEVLRWLMNFRTECPNPENITQDDIRQGLWNTLNSGRVIPGFGHAVLRKTDPRYTCQREFAQRYLGTDPLFKLVSDIYEVAPQVLLEHGKTKNPWPNVDAHSGVLLHYYGMTEANYYTVLFGVSRALGVLSNLTVSRAIGLPIERPKSITLDWIRKNC